MTSLALGIAAACVAAAVGGTAGRASTGRARDAVQVYAAHATLPLRTALFDPFIFDGPQRTSAFAMAHGAGAAYVRLVATWNTIAPAQPAPGFNAADPASPGYSWGAVDSAVADAEAAGLTPILDVTSAPTWALAIPGSGDAAGTPDIAALHEFAIAVATHFDGEHGAPPVHVFQIWNEPNVTFYLSPVDASAYRSMVNAFAGPVHAADPANIVVAGDLDPFGGKAARYQTMAPLTFMRSLLCLSKGAHPHATCNTPAQFDVWSHHPYTFNGPFGHARRPDDVSLGDLPKMRALLAAASRLHHIVSARPVQFWVTEFSWDTNPPRLHAAPVGLEARWSAEALYQMWRSGVSLVVWFLLQDQPTPSPYQSGLYFPASSLGAARAKPMLTSFRFPFVAYREKGGVSVWGRDATSKAAVVTVQLRSGKKGWRTVARIRANAYGIFTAKLRLATSTRDSLRATAAGSGTSLAFSLQRPSSKIRFGPWGN
ncbi:MAG TPA: cellulase family glycosylhydrolase [Gaiellaceae bacterium]|nr:cellulase family glycosylhydrolase [Gaiellaceae bacterium]